MDDIELNATNNDNLDVDQTTTVEPTVETTATEKDADNKPLSLDEAVERAFNKHEKTDGKPDSKPAAPKDKPRETVAADERTTNAEGKTIDPVTGRELQPINAPSSWTPALREKWGTIDPQVQQFIANREKNIQETLSKTAEDRRVAKEFVDIFEPHRALLVQHGVTAAAYTKDVVDFSVKLNTGTPQEKAALIHQLIIQQKPDPTTLQALFSGQRVDIPQRPAPQKTDAQMREEWQRQYEEQQQVQSATAELEAFASKNEFYNDVRDHMQKIIEAGLVDGATLPELFKNAYDMAINAHPEIRQILAARQPAQQMQAPTAKPAPAKKPVGSVKPGLGSGKPASSPKAGRMSLDDAVEEAFREHGMD